MADKDEIREQLLKEGRLWVLSFACAVPAAVTVYLTNSLLRGVMVFLVLVAVLGSALWWYEHRDRR